MDVREASPDLEDIDAELRRIHDRHRVDAASRNLPDEGLLRQLVEELECLGVTPDRPPKSGDVQDTFAWLVTGCRGLIHLYRDSLQADAASTQARRNTERDLQELRRRLRDADRSEARREREAKEMQERLRLLNLDNQHLKRQANNVKRELECARNGTASMQRSHDAERSRLATDNKRLMRTATGDRAGNCVALLHRLQTDQEADRERERYLLENSQRLLEEAAAAIVHQRHLYGDGDDNDDDDMIN